MGKISREREQKSCDACSTASSILYRVRLAQQEPWLFYCSDCQSKAKSRAAYQYGGTWKQIKRN